MKIAVGLSGGVDSSVAAKLLLDQGHEVLGIFIKTWDSADPHCPAALDASDARMVADHLGIPFYVFDLSESYRQDVFDYFLEQNKKGLTPNPDILCNQYVKFGTMLEKALELGAEKLATGHYARVQEGERARGQEGKLGQEYRYELRMPKDRDKDQTYFLHRLSQEQLSRALFPLENLEKKEIRAMAKDLGLITAEKKDSTGICMVGERDYTTFLKEYFPEKKGDIVELETGETLGQHTGLLFYTLGQRKGVGVGGVKDRPDAPWFVVRKDFETNQLIVSQDESALLGSSLEAGNLHWIAGNPPSENFTCSAQIRYRMESVECAVKLGNDIAKVHFKTPVRAITPGQSVVFYDGAVCLGGGEIR